MIRWLAFERALILRVSVFIAETGCKCSVVHHTTAPPGGHAPGPTLCAAGLPNPAQRTPQAEDLERGARAQRAGTPRPLRVATPADRAGPAWPRYSRQRPRNKVDTQSISRLPPSKWDLPRPIGRRTAGTLGSYEPRTLVRAP